MDEEVVKPQAVKTVYSLSKLLYFVISLQC